MYHLASLSKNKPLLESYFPKADIKQHISLYNGTLICIVALAIVFTVLIILPQKQPDGLLWMAEEADMGCQKMGIVAFVNID